MNPKGLNIEETFRNILKENQFINSSFENYGNPSGFQTYGVMGNKVKQSILELWRSIMYDTHDMGFLIYEIDTPIIGPEQVYISSGHVGRFTDPVMKDKNNRIERVDHYLKALISKSDISDNEKNEIINNLDNYSNDELQNLLDKYITSPEKERKFSKIYEQNLMLSTNTSYSDNISYLRPETAQGLITEFTNVYKFNNNTLPFGISQIGRVYRKEISPRPFIRLREFEQAEIEMFFDPLAKPQLSDAMKNMILNIYYADDQEHGMPYNVSMSKRMIGETNINAYIAYFMCKVWILCKKFHIDTNRIRFRQHMKNELAHYSNDCWDLEYLVRDKSTDYNKVDNNESNWIEVIGIANRGCFDLTQHSHAYPIKVKSYFDTPVTKIDYGIVFDMKVFGKKFNKNASTYKDMISELKNTNTHILDEMIEAFKNNDTYEYQNISLEPDMMHITKTSIEISSEEYIPHIIEPSFGVDRMIYMVLNNSFWIRPSDIDENKKNMRTVLSLGKNIAPYTFAVFPLMQKEPLTQFINNVTYWLIRLNPNRKIMFDNSSAKIGKKYTRVDEIGIPYVITIDYQTIQDDTVTVRDRDTMKQVRIQIDKLDLNFIRLVLESV